MIYHTAPGKAPALESIFRDVAKLQTKHNLNVAGYWVPAKTLPGETRSFTSSSIPAERKRMQIGKLFICRPRVSALIANQRATD